MPKYLGPSDVFYLHEGGKPYHRGDNVPISEAVARHMGRVISGGHLFEGVEAEERPRGSDIQQARRHAEAVEEARDRADAERKK